MDYKQHKTRYIRHFFTVPFIYMMVIPILVLDLCMEIYHQCTFRLCTIPLVKRSSYIRIDRHKLQYLRPFDKVNCAYCGYANGLAAYFVEIAGRTEKYWCGIRHKDEKGAIMQPHQKDFLEYGDEKTYKKKFGDC
ncbi:MAG: hypothetical protein KKF44_11310 [Nanoarchaeota archaeon]|nr:hypothetical protein [Nanoarchaeota archaeon]